MKRRRLIDLRVCVFLVMLAVPFTQGCSNDDEKTTGSSVSQGSSSISPNDQARSAMNLSDLAYKYENLKINEKGELFTLIKRDKGCTIADDFLASVSVDGLMNSVGSYCGLLSAQGIAVQDCARAQEFAVRLMEEVYDLDADCEGVTTARRRGRFARDHRRQREAAALRRQVNLMIDLGVDYHRALGLPEIERVGHRGPRGGSGRR